MKKKAIIWITGILSGVLAATMVWIGAKIQDNHQAAEAITQEILPLKEEVERAKEQETDYKTHLQALEQEISRYEPVIIPDSMKVK